VTGDSDDIEKPLIGLQVNVTEHIFWKYILQSI